MKNSKFLPLFLAALALLSAPRAHALDQIIRAWESPRTSAMGGVLLSTGLYDQNFFGNPARATANPEWRVTLFDPTIEFKPNFFDTVKAAGSNSDFYTNIGNKAGDNYHARIQLSVPTWYLPPTENRSFSIAVGLLTSIQFDGDLRRSYTADVNAIVDLGPAVTVAKQFGERKELSVGATAHVAYRVSMDPAISFSQILQGQNISLSSYGGQGGAIDFDLGATYKLPDPVLGFEIQPAIAFNNLLGGKFTNLGQLIKSGGVPNPSGPPVAQPRTLGFGASAHKAEAGPMRDLVVALEVQDIGNNANASMFRLLHLGAESRFGILLPRLGINEGYFTAGLGVDLKHFTLDFATYGEEMSLNPGGFEDRRYAIKVAFQI